MNKDETDRKNRQPAPEQPRPDPGLTDLIRRDRALARPMAGTINVDETGLTAEESDTWDIEQGANVLSADNEKLGEVVDIVNGYLVVEQGFFDPQDIYVPISAIVRHDDEGIYLSYTRDEFEDIDWSQFPGDGPADDPAADESDA